MPVDVLCIGHAAFDLSAFLEDFPRENSKCETQDSLESCGGPAANAAWLLSSWGLRCAFAGQVGDDVFGRRIRDEFLAAGTDVSLLDLHPARPTPLSVLLVSRRNGSRTIVNRKPRSAPLVLPPELLLPLAPRMLLFDGHERDASLQALQLFPGALSLLDAGSWREGTEALAGRVHYLAASERFAQQATGLDALLDPPGQRLCLARLRRRFPAPPVIIVTLGEQGLILDEGDGRDFRHLPAFPAPAVDTTAAGDIFHGALAFALLRGQPLWEALRFASMSASLSVRKPGGRSSTPTPAEVEAALKDA